MVGLALVLDRELDDEIFVFVAEWLGKFRADRVVLQDASGHDTCKQPHRCEENEDVMSKVDEGTDGEDGSGGSDSYGGVYHSGAGAGNDDSCVRVCVCVGVWVCMYVCLGLCEQ